MPTPTKFGTEFLVNTTTSSNQSEPSITALSNGRFVVAWSDLSQTGVDTSGFAVRAQIFNADGSPEGAEFLVNSTTTGNQSPPDITALANGGFVVVWHDSSQTGTDTSDLSVRAQVFGANGTKSGGEFVVNSTTFDRQYLASTAALSDGSFVVAWVDSSQTGGDTSGLAVRAQVFAANGSKSGAEFLVNTTTSGGQYGPSLTALTGGRFVVTWNDDSLTGGDTSSGAIRAQVFNADGSKAGTEFLVNTTTNDAQAQPDITALSNGGFVVTWTDLSRTGGDTSEFAVRAQVFDEVGNKSGTEILVNTITNSHQVEPTVAALTNGHFVVAWSDLSQTAGDTNLYAIRAQVFEANGVKAGSEFLVNTTSNGNQTQPSIASLPNGRFAVTWTDASVSGGDSSGASVRAQIFDANINPAPLGNLIYSSDFNDGVLNGDGWLYRSTHNRPNWSAVSEHDGYLEIRNDLTDNGGRADLTLPVGIYDAVVDMSRFYHANGSNFFGENLLNFTASDGSSVSINLSMLRSSYAPDYLNIPENFDRPRLGIYDAAGGAAVYFGEIASSAYYDVWVDQRIQIDSSAGRIQIDLNGDGALEFNVTDGRLVGATLDSIGFDAYGWYTGHYTRIDDLSVSGVRSESADLVPWGTGTSQVLDRRYTDQLDESMPMA